MNPLAPSIWSGSVRDGLESALLPARSFFRGSFQHTPQIDFKHLGHPKERVQGRISEIAFDEADHALRKPRPFCEPRHGKPALLALFTQLPHDRQPDGTPNLWFWHAPSVTKKGFDTGHYYSNFSP